MSESPARLRPQGPHAAAWSFIGQVKDGEDVADGWQLRGICVMSSVDVDGDGLAYHLSVRIQGSPMPPPMSTIEFVSEAFGLPSLVRMEPGEDRRIVHLCARVAVPRKVD